MDRSLIPAMMQAVGGLRPVFDLFTEAHNTVFGALSSPPPNAFAVDWNGERPLWCNPPFVLLPAVEEHIRHKGAP